MLIMDKNKEGSTRCSFGIPRNKENDFMNKNTKVMVLLMSVVLLFLLAGCSVSVGQKNDPMLSKDFYEIFDKEKPKNGAYVNSKLIYNFTTQSYGKMYVAVDTTNGHSFHLDESGDFFTIEDKAGNVVIKANFYLKENYKKDSAKLTNIETINFRDYFVGDYNGGYYAMSYMADCGLDLGIFLQAKDKEDFHLVAFGGTPLEGSSSDIHFYQGDSE